MRVAIIGGGGLVGSCAGFALQCGGIVSELDLIDVNGDLVKGHTLDLLHGASLAADQRIRNSGYEVIPHCDLVIITAGLRRKPDESRLDLINRNTQLFLTILDQVKAAGLSQEAVVLVVSNPVDILTYVAAHKLGLSWSRVMGLGTVLDTARFRSLIAEAMSLPATQVSATILGEHGDSMVPIWSHAQIAGMPLSHYPGWSTQLGDQLFQRTRGGGAEAIKLKGGAGFAVGLSIREVVHAVALDSKRILPVSSVIQGAYGIRDVALSVPTIVGRSGVVAQLQLELSPRETSALQSSARVLRETINQVIAANPDAAAATASRPASPSPAASKAVSTSGRGMVRVTMGGSGR